ncbi:SDR family oxidoreductase [Rubrimonas cliftonensis]|uniref:NADP-dependent 3-hydroxy acid dehydrogenase YdfG n=1 Tax=Rubrimonas cliftonensis TaxID=89524 RepID=A0A1H3YTC7_9RHOB|nr:SDR family oxidoreductase [Rubrimonas cliftonensis]SEA14660.1 NADP-dependent 3-hydroxy acid dehydrogenase YdfG [Rubrimonas cliftonensis]
MSAELQGKAALVTGASRGIGAAAAAALAEAGVSVTLAARTVAEAETHAATIRAAGGRAQALACDVADAAAVEAAVAATEDAFGRFDILVNNAGLIDPIGRLADVDPEAWGKVIDVNVKGVFHGLRAALPRMAAQGAGVVVNISSGAATNALEGWAHYCASKAAALMLTRCAHVEYGAQGVRVVGLSPGTVATYMQETIRASGVNAVSRLDWSAHIPPEWPARAIVWLCTEDAREFDGGDVSLGNEEIRRRAGLIP